MKYDENIKQEAVTLSEEIGIEKAAAQLGISVSAICRWRSQHQVSEYTKHDESLKQEAVKLSKEIGIKEAAAQLGVSVPTIYDWRCRYQVKKYDENFKREAIKLSEEIGILLPLQKDILNLKQCF